jgi:hypothetical protein
MVIAVLLLSMIYGVSLEKTFSMLRGALGVEEVGLSVIQQGRLKGKG